LIPRKATIIADGKQHKVTVNILTLPANFEYTVAPKIGLSAYLGANMLNVSSYPILPGPLNVFMEGDFVAKSIIWHMVSPRESFGIFLGTDDNIKTVYTFDNKLKKESGVFQKTASRELSSRIIITNNSKKDVTMVVYEHAPKSNSSQLVVTLVEPPDLKPPEDYAKINMDAPVLLTPSNNVRWKCFAKRKTTGT